MAKLTQAEVKGLADEWAGFQAKIARAEAKRNEELDPFIVEYNEKTKPITAKHDAKIQKLKDEQAAIGKRVTEWLASHGKAIVLEGEAAVAANEVKVGSRVIDAEKFFSLVKAKGSEFWGCVTVQIAKAEKFLGKTEVDKISSKESKLVPVLKLK